MLHLEKKDFLHFFHQLKPPLLLYIRVLLVIYLAQKHTLLPNPKRIVPVKPAVNHIFFLGFRMKSHIFNDVILVLKMLIYSVDFYFAFFHYFVSSFFPTFLSSMALLILLSAATWTRIISANLWDLLKIYASKFLWKRDYIWIILYVFLPALIC